MGYSIFIIAKDKSLQDKMGDFLTKNLIGFNKLYYKLEDCYYGLAVGPEEISYNGGNKNPLMIGFNFNASGGERAHMFELLQWMNKKIGSEGDVYYYDGEQMSFGLDSIKSRIEKETNRLASDPRNKGRLIESLRESVTYIILGAPGKEADEIFLTINNDIKRLDELWNQIS